MGSRRNGAGLVQPPSAQVGGAVRGRFFFAWRDWSSTRTAGRPAAGAKWRGTGGGGVHDVDRLARQARGHRRRRSDRSSAAPAWPMEARWIFQPARAGQALASGGVAVAASPVPAAAGKDRMRRASLPAGGTRPGAIRQEHRGPEVRADKSARPGGAGANGMQFGRGPFHAGVVVVMVEDEAVHGGAGVLDQQGVAAGDELPGRGVHLGRDIGGQNVHEPPAGGGAGVRGCIGNESERVVGVMMSRRVAAP